MKMPERCDRCGESLEGKIFSMSRFNTEWLCENCIAEEKQHPDYQKAVDAEFEEVRKGNLNFPGIGYPGKNGRVK